MEAKSKKWYASPAMQVVELQPKGILCFSDRSLDWRYESEGEIFLPKPDVDWDRPGYGDAQEF